MLRADEFFRQVIEDIDRTDAQCLFAHFLDLTREKLIMHPETLIPETKQQEITQAAEKIKAGYPTPYIVQKQAFWGRDFYVNSHVLIPRPDTETLIECAMRLCGRIQKDSLSILDMGTGSGIIAITLALECPNATVSATDISHEALSVAKQNAQLHRAHVTFFQGSWYEALGSQSFDLICSNPPYIDRHDPHLRNLTFEPIHALTDGNDGLDCIRAILADAHKHLNAHGWLVIEHGYDQAEAVRALFQAHDFMFIQTCKDLGGNDRVTFGCLPV